MPRCAGPAEPRPRVPCASPPAAGGLAHRGRMGARVARTSLAPPHPEGFLVLSRTGGARDSGDLALPQLGPWSPPRPERPRGGLHALLRGGAAAGPSVPALCGVPSGVLKTPPPFRHFPHMFRGPIGGASPIGPEVRVVPHVHPRGRPGRGRLRTAAAAQVRASAIIIIALLLLPLAPPPPSSSSSSSSFSFLHPLPSYPSSSSSSSSSSLPPPPPPPPAFPSDLLTHLRGGRRRRGRRRRGRKQRRPRRHQRGRAREPLRQGSTSLSDVRWSPRPDQPRGKGARCPGHPF